MSDLYFSILIVAGCVLGFTIFLLWLYLHQPLEKLEEKYIALMPDGEWNRKNLKKYRSKAKKLIRLRELHEVADDRLNVKGVLDNERLEKLGEFYWFGRAVEASVGKDKYQWIGSSGTNLIKRPEDAPPGKSAIVTLNGRLLCEAWPFRGKEWGFKFDLPKGAYKISWSHSLAPQYRSKGFVVLDGRTVGVFDDTKLERGYQRILLAVLEDLPKDDEIVIIGLLRLGLYDAYGFGKW